MDLPKRILLCNDDGFDATGILSLERALSSLGELWVIAPEQERSGCSHAMNFRDTLGLIKVRERAYKVRDGYPADCVNLGFCYQAFPDFNLVVSGINHGPNLGDDVHYSGTVAVARQAAIHNIRNIAISAVDLLISAKKMERIAEWLKSWIIENYKRLDSRIVYNINYPEEIPESSYKSEEKLLESSSAYPPVIFSHQGHRKYKDSYSEVSQDNKQAGLELLRLDNTILGHIEEEQSDFEAVHNHNISITPLSTSSTAKNELAKWQKL